MRRDLTSLLGTVRDYGNGDAGIGLEGSPDAWVEQMVAVFREVRRVLRDDGTVWLNVGDAYASGTKGSGGDGTASSLNCKRDERGGFHEESHASGNAAKFEPRKVDLAAMNLKQKDLIGLPWMLAFALRADGWYLRSDIIWSKPNPMPESVRDHVEAHRDLLWDLDNNYDGWAYSLSSTSLKHILPEAPPSARIASWVKPFAAFKKNVRIAYTWEPVLFVPGRDRSKDGASVGRDHLSEPITLKKGLTGAKPEAFCRWVLDLMGYVIDDEVDDLFPGTGVMHRVIASIESGERPPCRCGTETPGVVHRREGPCLVA